MFLNSECSNYSSRISCATAMYLARKICNTDENKNLFYYYSDISQKEIADCFYSLRKILQKASKFNNLERKYGENSLFKVGNLVKEFVINLSKN